MDKTTSNDKDENDDTYIKLGQINDMVLGIERSEREDYERDRLAHGPRWQRRRKEKIIMGMIRVITYAIIGVPVVIIILGVCLHVFDFFSSLF